MAQDVIHSSMDVTLCTANEVHNTTPQKDGEHSNIELFTQLNTSPKLLHFHTLRRSIYVLDSKLQSRTSIPSGIQEPPANLLGTITKLCSVSESSPKSANRECLTQFLEKHDDFFK